MDLDARHERLVRRVSGLLAWCEELQGLLTDGVDRDPYKRTRQLDVLRELLKFARDPGSSAE